MNPILLWFHQTQSSPYRVREPLLSSQNSEPLRRLLAHGDQARDAVLAHARQQLAHGHDPQAVLDYVAHTLTNRVLHAPTAALRTAAQQGDAQVLRAAEKLFSAIDAASGVDTAAGMPGPN